MARACCSLRRSGSCRPPTPTRHPTSTSAGPDGTLHLVSFGPTPPTYLGENADGAVVFTTPDNAGADGDGLVDLYLRRRDGGLVLLTPGTAAQVTATLPSSLTAPHIPSDQGRVVFDTPDKLLA